MCTILSPEASNLRNNFGVHTIGPSSLHLPWPFANLAIHSHSSIRKEHKKISCISMYKFLSNHYSFINCGFLFSCTVNSWIFLSNHSSIYFFVGFQWCDITHCYADLGPSNETICWLMGSWPRFKVKFCQINPYTTHPFSINPQSADWYLTWSSMGGCWNQVFTRKDEHDVVLCPNPAFALIDKPLRLINITSLNQILYLCKGLWLSFADPKQVNKPLTHLCGYS